MRVAISARFLTSVAALLFTGALAFGQAGSLDPTFGSGGVLLTRPPLVNTNDAGPIWKLVELNTGKLLGLAPAYDNPNTFRAVLIRTAADGVVDTSFGNSGYVYIAWSAPNPGSVNKMALQPMPDGSERILISGQLPCGRSSCTRVERYTSDGALDTSFGTNGATVLQAGSLFGDILVAPDRKIIVGGSLNPLMRLNADGTPDTSFGPGGISKTKPVVEIQALKLHNGKIIAAGTISAGASANNFGIARFDLDGKLDTTFGSSGKVSIDFAKMNDIAVDVAVDPAGRILVCGEATYAKTTPAAVGYDAVIVRLTPNGQLDGTFGVGGKTRLNIGDAQDHFTSILLQADGKIVVAGEGRNPGSRADVLTARYTENGTLDTSYSGDGWNLTELTGEYDTGQSALLQYDANCGCIKLVVGAGAGGGGSVFGQHALLRYLL